MAKQKAEVRADDSKTYAFIATFLSIIGVFIALLTKKDDKYVKFYVKQSLVVFIAGLILWVLAAILSALFWQGPTMMYYYYASGPASILHLLANLGFFLLWLVSWIYALSGEMKEVPVVGQYARKLNF